MPKKRIKNRVKKSEKEKQSDTETLMGFLCYLISIIGVVIVLATKQERGKFSLYHAKQGLVFFIFCVILWIIATVFAFIPIIGWLIWLAVLVLTVWLWITGMINALNKKMKPLPLIGHFAKRFNF